MLGLESASEAPSQMVQEEEEERRRQRGGDLRRPIGTAAAAAAVHDPDGDGAAAEGGRERGVQEEGGGLLLQEGEGFLPIGPGAPLLSMSTHDLADVAAAAAVVAHSSQRHSGWTQRGCERLLRVVRLRVLLPECLQVESLKRQIPKKFTK